MSYLGSLQAQTPQMLEAVQRLVEVESPSSDPAACRECLRVAQEIAADLLPAAGELLASDGRTHLVWRFSDCRR